MDVNTSGSYPKRLFLILSESSAEIKSSIRIAIIVIRIKVSII